MLFGPTPKTELLGKRTRHLKRHNPSETHMHTHTHRTGHHFEWFSMVKWGTQQRGKIKQNSKAKPNALTNAETTATKKAANQPIMARPAVVPVGGCCRSGPSVIPSRSVCEQHPLHPLSPHPHSAPLLHNYPMLWHTIRRRQAQTGPKPTRTTGGCGVYVHTPVAPQPFVTDRGMSCVPLGVPRC